ncbi:phosphatidylinositol/phosphatidylcholine transfer protein SFH11-like isoform X2 [Magnolia sinica]|uniref:phosphatidylinositol/phosphatidylcholine transfer protein SFH11-like isoform X2 n=1 Tax=Magnolia sinica TaxID=86752 RepID=UPI00265B0505|nr:phosphatidylinositol/phosphatidylcholine transfer protein SFH11-like isoform X2 [Magnolia sinica]
MPPSKGSVNESVATTGSGIGSDHGQSLSKKGKANPRDVPIEEHFHFPVVEKKQSSLRKLSFKSMRNSLKKFGRSKAMQKIYGGPHNPRDEQMVQDFRNLLLKEGQLPEKHDDYHTLLRFLRMRAFDMQKAKDMYLKMLKWRSDFNIDTIDKDFIFDEYADVKKFYPHGFHEVDRYGRPLYIERLGLLDLNSLLTVTTIERFLKYHIIEQEKTLYSRYPACSVAVKKHIASTTAILDVKGLGRNNFSKPARDLFMEIQKIDSNYYPETLHQLFIVNAGSGFRALWQVLKAFLEPRTVAKIHVLGSTYQSELVKAIDPRNLPNFLGGTCTCSEYGGCLLKDRGPWTNTEILDLLQAVVDKEPTLGIEETSNMAFDEALEDFDREQKFGGDATSSMVPDSGDAYSPARQTWDKEHGGLEQHAQTDYVTNILPHKVLALEVGYKEMKAILQRLLVKQEDLVRQIQQLKELAFPR